MGRSTKDAWLQGPGDLAEADVDDVPVKGSSVRVRGLPAAYSNEAMSEALELRQGSRGEQSATINTAKLEVLQFAHGCIDPTFTVGEAEEIAKKFGPAFKKVIAKIDELSGVDKASVEATQTMFPVGGTEPANGGATGPVALTAGGR